MCLKRFFCFLVAFTSFGLLQAQNWESIIFSESGDSREEIVDVVRDDNGNSFLLGNTVSESFDFRNISISNNGGRDIFLLKLNSNDSVEWAYNFGGVDYDAAIALDIDANGDLYILGEFNSASIDVAGTTIDRLGNVGGFIAKFSSAGDNIWTKRISTTFGFMGLKEVIATAEGPMIAGQFQGEYKVDTTTVGNDTGRKIYFTQLDTDGDLDWEQHNSTEGEYDLIDILLRQSNEDSIFAGVTIKGWDGDGIYFDNIPNLLDTNFILNVSETGVSLKSNLSNGPGGIADMIFDGNNAIYLSLGTHKGEGFVFSLEDKQLELPNRCALRMLSPDGTMLWNQLYDSIPMSFKSIVLEDNEIWMAGSFASSEGTMIIGGMTLPNFGSPFSDVQDNDRYIDCFTARMDTNGTILAAQSFGGTNFEHFDFLFVENGQQLILGNFNSDSVSMGTHTMYNPKEGYEFGHVTGRRLVKPYSFFMASQLNSGSIGIEEPSQETWNVYPNPVISGGEIHWKDIESGNIRLYNGQGQLIREWQEQKSGLSLEHIESGMYILQLSTKYSQKSIQLIIR